MARQGFGTQDRDRIGKEKTDKPLRGPGTDPVISAKIGGVGNLSSASAKKTGGKMAGKPFPFAKKKAR